MSVVAIRSVLVASDLSEGSDEIVRAAAQLADRAGARLHALHAMEVLGRPVREASLDLLGLRELTERTRSALHEQILRSLPRGVAADTVKLDYRPAARAILRRAQEVDADLIVVGPHHSRLPGGDPLGTTAQQVVAGASVPCLVTRRPLPFPLRRVLLPVGTCDVEHGLLAAGGRWLVALLRQGDPDVVDARAELCLLHVTRAPFEWRAFSEELTRSVRTLRDQAGVDSLLQVHRHLAWSRLPADEILRTAEMLASDVILMGVRGQGPLLRALLGSVAADVLRRATAPVVLFPPLACARWAAGGGEPALVPAGVGPADVPLPR